MTPKSLQKLFHLRLALRPSHMSTTRRSPKNRSSTELSQREPHRSSRSRSSTPESTFRGDYRASAFQVHYVQYPRPKTASTHEQRDSARLSATRGRQTHRSQPPHKRRASSQPPQKRNGPILHSPPSTDRRRTPPVANTELSSDSDEQEFVVSDSDEDSHPSSSRSQPSDSTYNRTPKLRSRSNSVQSEPVLSTRTKISDLARLYAPQLRPRPSLRTPTSRSGTPRSSRTHCEPIDMTPPAKKLDQLTARVAELQLAGDEPAATKLLIESLVLAQLLYGIDDMRVIEARFAIAQSYMAQGLPAQALPYALRAKESNAVKTATEPASEQLHPRILLLVGMCYSLLGDAKMAQRHIFEALRATQLLYGLEDARCVAIYRTLAKVQEDAKLWNEARTTHMRARRLQERISPDDPELANMAVAEAGACLKTGDVSEAVALLRRAFERFEAAKDCSGMGATAEQLGALFVEHVKDPVAAEQWYARAAEAYAELYGTTAHDKVIAIRQAELGVLRSRGDHDQAARKIREVLLPIMENCYGQQSKEIGDMLVQLGRELRAAARWSEAEEPLKRALKIFRMLQLDTKSIAVAKMLSNHSARNAKAGGAANHKPDVENHDSFKS